MHLWHGQQQSSPGVGWSSCTLQKFKTATEKMWWLFWSFLQENLCSSSLTRFCWGLLQHHNDCSIRNSPELRSLSWGHLWKGRNSNSNLSEVRSHTHAHWLLFGKHSKIFDYRLTNSTKIKTQNQQETPKSNTCSPSVTLSRHSPSLQLTWKSFAFWAKSLLSDPSHPLHTHYQRLSAPNTEFYNLGRGWIPAKRRFSNTAVAMWQEEESSTHTFCTRL